MTVGLPAAASPDPLREAAFVVESQPVRCPE